MAALVAALVEVLGPVLIWAGRLMVVSLITRALVAFGLSFVVWHFAVGPIIDAIKAQASGMPAAALQWLGLLQFDKALTVVCSAYVIRFGLSSVHLVKS